MRNFGLFVVCLWFSKASAQPHFVYSKDSTELQLTLTGASHLALLPLHCIQQEFPNKTSHITTSMKDGERSPKQMHPAFYGCFDWHSSVHGHWMLIRLLKKYPSLPEAQNIRENISNNINVANINQEIQYFQSPLNKSYERTYGWAWLLKLQQELLEWNDPEARNWSTALQPLCDTVVQLWMRYLPKQTYSNRTGVHPNTAFGLAFALDYAIATKQQAFKIAIVTAAKRLYGQDKNAPTSWEPDGTDFLSPSLEEADLMRRVLQPQQFITWLNSWLSPAALQHLTQIPTVSDRTDLQIVHLDGLCFSRSWCMKGIASALLVSDKRKRILIQAATKHLKASLPNVASGSYGGEHWLASFAVYALTN